MKKSKLHLVVFVWYHPPSLRTTVTKQILQVIFTKRDSKLQSVSKQNHSCELQLYKISAYDKKRPKLDCWIFCGSVSVLLGWDTTTISSPYIHFRIFPSKLSVFFSFCSNAYENGDSIQKFGSINLKEKTCHHPSPSIALFVAC